MASWMLKMSGSGLGPIAAIPDVSQRLFPMIHPIWSEVGFMITLIVPMLPIMKEIGHTITTTALAFIATVEMATSKAIR